MAEPAERMEEQISEEERQAQYEMEQRKFAVLESLAHELERKKEAAVSHRTHIETRMLLDEQQYWGVTQGRLDKEDIASGTSFRGTRPVDNKTRAKTRIAAARAGDMLFPTNAPNWALRPTPDPDIPDEDIKREYMRQLAEKTPLDQEMPEERQPLLPVNRAALADKVAGQRCKRMSRKIADVLAEVQYNKIGRQVILDGCKLGTGIIKGPYNKHTLQRRYIPITDPASGRRVDTVLTKQSTKPAVARVSPWMFFPMPARCIEECEGAFELHLYNKTQLIQMIETHGFLREQVAKLAVQSPQRGSVDSILARRAAVTGNEGLNYEECWAVWEYHGPLSSDDLKTLQIDLPEDDELSSVYAEVWFADGVVVRVTLSPLEADSSLPYHVFNYETDETSIFGYGIPFIMRDDQAVIDTIWDAMLYNAQVSAGPQIGILQGKMTPADGNHNIHGPKLWYLNDEDTKIQDALQVHQIPSTVNNIMPLYQQARENADENTNLPLMLGDAAGSGTGLPTSGIAMLINQQNIVQRQIAHSWDDSVTSPLIRRLYDWFMQHDEDPEIKGDYEVEVRGASYLLVKDTQAQHAQLLIQLVAQDPTLASMLELEELYRIYLEFMDIPIERLIKSSEQIERERAQQQPDPIQQLEMQKLEAEAAKAQAEAQKAQAEVQQPQGGPERISEKDVLDYEVEMAKIQQQSTNLDRQYEIEQLRAETAMVRVAADEGIAYEKIHADMQKFREKLSSDTSWKQRQQQSKEFFDAARLRLDEFRDQLKATNLQRGYDTF